MGQAKIRGTFEKRKQESIAAYEERQRQHYIKIEMLERSMSEEEKQIRIDANKRAGQLLSMMVGITSGLQITNKFK